MTQPAPVVFLFDVDNTLVDNDRVIADLLHYLEREIGYEHRQRYYAYFEELRSKLGYVDYLGALQLYRAAYPRDFHILRVSTFLLNYPFANRLYPRALEVIEHSRRLAKAVAVTDGDVVFQPRKVQGAGLLEAFDNNVLIYIHKENELDDIVARYPAEHYVFVDDKLRILTAVKRSWGERVTTVFPVQGHYALDQGEIVKYPSADVTIDSIGGLLDYGIGPLIAAARR